MSEIDGWPAPRLTARQEQELMRVRAEGSIGEGHGVTYRVRNDLRRLGLLEIFSAEPLGAYSLYRPTRWRLTSRGRWVCAKLAERTKRSQPTPWHKHLRADRRHGHLAVVRCGADERAATFSDNDDADLAVAAVNAIRAIAEPRGADPLEVAKGLVAELAKLRGMLWYAWMEMNAIRAESGVPRGYDGQPKAISEEYWSAMVDAMAATLGDDAKPWPTEEAKQALAALGAGKVGE